MVVRASGLEHHENGAAGSNSVIGLVVAVQRLELSDRILRGQIHKAAAAAAIILLAAVDHVDVVGGSGSIEADAVCRRQRIHAAKGRKGIRHSETKRRQRSDVSAIRCQLLNLCAADQRTYLAGLGLHLQGIGCHCHGLRLAANGENRILFHGLGDVHDDAGFGVLLKTLCGNGQRVGADANVREAVTAGLRLRRFL